MLERELIIMRHATAGGGAARDFERKLTVSGREEATRVGRRMAELEYLPDQVFCSAALRCRETWQCVAAELDSSPAVDYETELYGASADQLRRVLAGAADAKRVLVLAHNPGVSVFAYELGQIREADSELLRGGFAPACIARFSVEAEWALLSAGRVELIEFQTPSKGPTRSK